MYSILRKLFFLTDAEKAHYLAMNLLQKTPFARLVAKTLFQFKSSLLAKDLWGLHFANPVGLGAGFDKNAVYLPELAALGFGFVEVGTVTPVAQPGNEKPRLFRLPQDKAIINRMGFNNDGAEAIKRRLMKWKQHHPTTKKQPLIVGCNIGKNKVTGNEDAWKDYLTCFEKLHESADYFVVNVSSPNTPGLRALQDKDALYKILSQLQNCNYGLPQKKPLLLKIAPDLTTPQLDDIVALVGETKLDGIVATNTTISRSGLFSEAKNIETIGAGGLSGKPLQKRSTEVLQYLHGNLPGVPIVASGGIFTGSDAKEKLEAGAALVQVWTGFIYEGPGIVKKINKYLVFNK